MKIPEKLILKKNGVFLIALITGKSRSMFMLWDFLFQSKRIAFTGLIRATIKDGSKSISVHAANVPAFSKRI